MGVGTAAHRNPEFPPHWMLFLLVAAANGVAAKVKELGGAEHLAPTTVGGARLFGPGRPERRGVFRDSTPAQN